MSKKQTYGDALKILGLGAAMFIVFGLLAGVGGWRAELAESNFQANKIRLQDFLFGPKPRAVLVGSSISGRLLPSYFQGTQLAPLANLGLDGSGPFYGLNLVQSRPPSIVLVEANTLLLQPNENDEALESALRNPEFHAARYVPMLRADWRPSSLLYSLIKRQEHGTEKAGDNAQPEVTKAAARKRDVNQRYDDNGNKEKLCEMIRVLLNRGSKVILVRLPTGRPLSLGDDPNFALADELNRELGVPQLDLSAECASRGEPMSYTDGLHLAPSAARKAGRLMAQLIVRDDYR